MGRLIDADAFIASLDKYTEKPMTAGLCATLVEMFPTAFDKDKVVEELEKERHPEICGGWEKMRIDKAVEIVKRGGIE